MEKKALLDLLGAVKSGETSVEEAANALEVLPYTELGYATVDHQRQLMKGFPEVIFGPGKTVTQVVGILEELRHGGGNILVTRVAPEKAELVTHQVPG